MSQQELVNKVIRVLESCGIQYMATGSVVSSLQGEPRATHDLDLVVAIEPAQVKEVISAFPPPEYYLDFDAAKEAIQMKGTFNLIDVKGGAKVDFWLLTDEPFDKARFARAIEENVFGVKMRISSPEDTILMKLKWAELSGGSEKQFHDAQRVFEVQYDKLDLAYIDDWALKLKVENLWHRLKKDARPI